MCRLRMKFQHLAILAFAVINLSVSQYAWADTRFPDLSTEELKKKADLSQYELGGARIGIDYAREVLRRAETPTDKTLASNKLCILTARYVQSSKNVVESDLYKDALKNCVEAAHTLSSARDFKLLDKINTTLVILQNLRPSRTEAPQKFLNELLPIDTLDPVIADREIDNFKIMVELYIGHFDHAFGEPAKREAMFANINQWLDLANHIGNERGVGFALYYRGGLYERSGNFDQAARDYSQARNHLTKIGYLQQSSSMTDQLEKNLEFDHDGGPEAVALKAEKAALKTNDYAAAAKAEDALANILARQQRLNDRKKVLLSMLSNATKTNSDALLARAYFLVGQESFPRSETPLSKHDQLMKSAELYQKIGNINGEAMAMLGLVRSEFQNMEIRKTALRLADKSGKPYLQAILFQLDTLTKVVQKNYEGARISAEKCRDLYASINAQEQVAHCEVLLADIAKSEGDRNADCAHLTKARDLFSQLGFPSRVIQQENKMSDRMCHA